MAHPYRGFKTTDGGRNWSAMNSGLDVGYLSVPPDGYALPIDSTNLEVVYAGTVPAGVADSVEA